MTQASTSSVYAPMGLRESLFSVQSLVSTGTNAKSTDITCSCSLGQGKVSIQFQQPSRSFLIPITWLLVSQIIAHPCSSHRLKKGHPILQLCSFRSVTAGPTVPSISHIYPVGLEEGLHHILCVYRLLLAL